MLKNIAKTIIAVHKDAIRHGFHENVNSENHWRAMIMTEVAEAIDADRKAKYADMSQVTADINKATAKLTRYIRENLGGIIGKNEEIRKERETLMTAVFEKDMKDTVGDELADVIIRTYDMIGEMAPQEVIDERFKDVEINELHCAGDRETMAKCTFTEMAYRVMFKVMNCNAMEILEETAAMAFYCGIDLNTFVEAKIEYNKTRQYKHNKNY